ncbi:oxidoreductase domain-containing protein [Xylariomycetidae sp. FL0641]|nr:oxidoreductase domain-containing protein [Xylariomycetidae sp. FL0641]
MLAELKKKADEILGQRPPPPPPPQRHQPVRVVYRSNDVALPDGFLTTAPADARPVTYRELDFAGSPLPEYAGCYAAVVDHVLSPGECAALTRLAEASVPAEDYYHHPHHEPDGSPWTPARVNVGAGLEVQMDDYRRGRRIIWDQQAVVDRVWARVAAGAPGVRARLARVDPAAPLQGLAKKPEQEQEQVGEEVTGEKRGDFYRVNKRMRFLRYGAGDFFKPHCDSPYGEELPPGEGGGGGGGGYVQTFYTLHLYLNDSQQAVGRGRGGNAELRGGATSFLSRDGKRRIDVDPKAGRVLIFQHARLRHSGDEVTAGVKYTVRSDIMYRVVEAEKEGEARKEGEEFPRAPVKY